MKQETVAKVSLLCQFKLKYANFSRKLPVREKLALFND